MPLTSVHVVRVEAAAHGLSECKQSIKGQEHCNQALTAFTVALPDDAHCNLVSMLLCLCCCSLLGLLECLTPWAFVVLVGGDSAGGRVHDGT
eukprot:4462986-Pleurochrysis_carterae.AAC.2